MQHQRVVVRRDSPARPFQLALSDHAINCLAVSFLFPFSLCVLLTATISILLLIAGGLISRGGFIPPYNGLRGVAT